MTITKKDLHPYQIDDLLRLTTTYANSGLHATRGNEALLLDILSLNKVEDETEEEIEIREQRDLIDVIQYNCRFHRDVSALCLGSIMQILMKDPHNLF